VNHGGLCSDLPHPLTVLTIRLAKPRGEVLHRGATRLMCDEFSSQHSSATNRPSHTHLLSQIPYKPLARPGVTLPEAPAPG
jgi:hypothetical protein